MKETISQLKGICNDAKFADKLVQDIISLQKQMDIEPTLVHIPVSSAMKEYDFGHFKIIDTNYGIIFQTNGYKVIVNAWITSLYGQLKALMYYKDQYDKLSEQEQDNYEALLGGTTLILMNPLVCFTDDDYWINQATEIAKKQNELFQSLLNTPLQPEDTVADEEFKDQMEFWENLKESTPKEED